MIWIEFYSEGEWTRYSDEAPARVPKEATSEGWDLNAFYSFDESHVEQGSVYEAAQYLADKYGLTHRVWSDKGTLFETIGVSYAPSSLETYGRNEIGRYEI